MPRPVPASVPAPVTVYIVPGVPGVPGVLGGRGRGRGRGGGKGSCVGSQKKVKGVRKDPSRPCGAIGRYRERGGMRV